jgi:hypothetical protein
MSWRHKSGLNTDRLNCNSLLSLDMRTHYDDRPLGLSEPSLFTFIKPILRSALGAVLVISSVLRIYVAMQFIIWRLQCGKTRPNRLTQDVTSKDDSKNPPYDQLSSSL